MKYRKQKNIAAVMIGEGATNRSNFHESMTFLCTAKITDSLYLSYQWMGDVHPNSSNHSSSECDRKWLLHMEIKALDVDGNDIEEVIEVLKEAFTYARAW